MKFISKYTGDEIDNLLSLVESGEVSPSIEVDSSLSLESENPVKNKAVTEKLTELSGEIVTKRYTVGGILRYNGEFEAKEGYSYTDYIKITSSSYHEVYMGKVDANIYVLEYDADKNLLGFNVALGGDSVKPFTSKANAEYIRFSFMTINAENVYVLENVTEIWRAYSNKISHIEGAISENTLHISQLLDEVNKLETLGSYESNDEYIRAYVDANGAFLWGIKRDGSIEFAKGIPKPIKAAIEKVAAEVQTMVAAKSEENSDGYLEMTLDADGGIVSYRDKYAILHECVGIYANRLSLSKEGMSDFEKALKEDGFSTGASDLSEESYIQIPLPTSLVKVNISAPQFPTSKADEIEGVIEFFDHNGNYFKKQIEALALQGATSLGAPKKNIKFDFVDTEVKIGDWVAQDSFHLKSNYYDIFRGKSNLAYDYWLDIIRYKRSNIFRKPYIDSTVYSAFNGKENSNDFNNAVRLTPAGFPIELYFNGEYLGIYTWNIKKDKANYAMSREKVDNIHIDPDVINLLLEGMSIEWSRFEIRNPKPKAKDGWEMTTMDGVKYDGDYPSELIDNTSSLYNANNPSHVNSWEVKKRIIALKDACAEIKSKNNKETFEKYFDAEWFVDFFIWSNVVLDGDGQDRNTQYLYWGGKWYPTPYDCDQIFGNNWRGNYIYRKSQRVVDRDIVQKTIYRTFYNLYKDRIAERYAELVESGILTTEYICKKINDYMAIIGKDAYEKDLKKWNETPSYRESNDNPQWHFEGDYYEGTPSEWNNSTSYKVGDYVSMFIEGDTYYWKCIASNTGVRPYYDKYGENPMVGGFYDSLTRTEMWLKERFAFLSNNWK